MMQTIARQALLVFVFFCATFGLSAQQMQIRLQMNPNPSPYLYDWQSGRESASVIVTNQSGQDRFVRIAVTITDLNNDQLLAQTDPNVLPPLEVGPGVSTFNAEDILPYSAIQFAPRLEESAIRTGRIPAGRHQICVELLDAELLEPLARQDCRPFNIQQFQAPVLIAPADGDVLNPSDMVLFRWSPLTPAPPEGVNYRLAVFEVPPGQDPITMFRESEPIFERDVPGQTQAPVLLGDEIPLDLGGNFVWSVQALDAEERPLSEPDGWANPFMFVFETQAAGDCFCEECFINGLRAEIDGRTITPGNRFDVGDDFVVKPNVIVQCPPGCPLQFQVRWVATFIGDDGETQIQEFEGQELRPRPEQPGDLIIQYEIEVRCGDAPCKCGGASGEQKIRIDGKPVGDGPITEGPGVEDGDVTRRDTTIVRDPRDSIPRERVPRDSIPEPKRPPFERVPPDSIIDRCVMLPYATIPARGIDLGMIVDQPATFPYPRAVPIRADGVDWDYAIFGCDGCGDGPDEYWKAVRDNVRKFNWKLSGKGSLNSPFSADSVQNLDEQIADLTQQKAALQSERNERQAERDSLPVILQRRKDAAQAKIDNIDIELTRLDSLNRISVDSLTAVLDTITIRETWSRDLLSRRGKQGDSIEIEQKILDSLDAILRGDPTSAENDTLAIVQQLRDRAAQADSALRRKDQELISESERLAQAILDAEADVRTADRDYETLKQSSNSLATQITTIETQLFGNPRMRRYLEHMRTWSRQSSAMIARNFSATNLGADLTLRQGAVAQSADRILELRQFVRRRQEFVDFTRRMARFLDELQRACVRHPDTSKRAACAGEAGLIAGQSAAFSYVVDTTASSNLRIDPAKRTQLRQLRQQLNTVKGQIVGAGATVQAAAQALIAARNAYALRIQTLTQERETLQQNFDAAAARLAEAEGNYKSLADARLRDLEINGKLYLSQRHASATRRDQSMHMITLLNDSLATARSDTAQYHIYRKAVQADTADNNLAQSRLRTVRLSLAEVLNIDLQDELDALDKIIADLDKQIADLQAQIDALTARRTASLAGSKTASGVIVYYIPPPLEEILKDKTRFEELKDSMRTKRAKLQEARQAKVNAQKTLAKYLENIARQLVRLRKSKDLETALSAERDSMDRALTQLRTDRTLQFQDEQLDLQNKLQEHQDARNSAEQRERQAAQDSAQANLDVQQARSDMQTKLNNLQQQQADVATKQAQRDFEERQLNAIRLTLEQHANQLSEARAELDQRNDAMERAQNDLSRETARNDQRRASAARLRLDGARQTVRQQEDEVARLETQLQQSTNRHATRQRAFASADSLLTAARNQIPQLRKEYEAALDSLDARNQDLEEALSEWLHWRDEKRDAEGAIVNTNRDRRTTQDSVAARVDKDSDVKTQQAALAKYDNDIQAAKDAQTAAETAVSDIIIRRDRLLRKVDDDIANAESELETAQNNLRTFLLKEFKTVTHKVTITVEAEDEPADAYRSKDPKVQLVRQLTYAGSREPKFNNKIAGYTLKDFDKDRACPVDLGFLKPGGPTTTPPVQAASEPRTIALLYRNGEPLWPEWPVIPAGEVNLLARDVVPLAAAARDNDTRIQQCETQMPDCEKPKEQRDKIRDLGEYAWTGDGKFLKPQPHYETILWETPDPAKDKCEDPKETKVTYTAAEIAGDDPIDGISKHPVKPGVLIEVPDSLIGAPSSNQEVVARVVRGDHSGLDGEDVEFSVTLVAGDAEDYGFDGTDSTTTKSTDGSGYARAQFNFGKGFARFAINVKWMRAGAVCREESFDAVSPLHMQSLRFNNGPPDFAVLAAKRVWGGASASSVISSFPDSRDEDAAKNYAAQVHAIGAYWDWDINYVNDIHMDFRAPAPPLKVDPARDTTELFGMGRTLLLDPPEEEELTIEYICDERYEDICRPPKFRDTASTKKFDRFKIGAGEQLFTIVLDEPATPGELLNGAGKLDNQSSQFVALLSDLSFNCLDVELEEDDNGEQIARAGAVVWQAPQGFSTGMFGFSVTLDSVVVRAQMGAGIGGGIGHGNFDDPLSFYAEMDTAGNFLGTVANVPGIEVGGFKLRDGTRFSIDLHEERSMPGFTIDFKGIVIHDAALEMPPIFKNAERGRPPTLSVSDFAVGSSGLSGTIALGGTLFQAGFAGYLFEVDSAAIEFKDNALSGNAYLGGSLGLPSPFEGTLRMSVGRSGETWAAKVSTDDPISIPRLRTAFMLRSGTGISYDENKELGTLAINAVISSEQYGDMDIDGFEINSNGEIKADAIEINRAIKFGRGFQMHVNTVAFVLTREEYSLELNGGFEMPLIGINDVSGTASIAPGPSVSVIFDKAQIEFESGPLEFTGGFEYSGQEFKGEFDIGIKKLISNGLSGMFVVGTAPIDSSSSYTYWYAELTMGTRIPLGSTGLSLLELGGGVGYNYNPPVEDQEGSPSNYDDYSFKAVVGLGNSPGGEVFAGRLTMVLTPGVFSLNGKMWLLQMEENLFGEGQLNLRWQPEDQLDGFVRMYIALPNAEGDIAHFNGKINYLYSASDFYIKSEELSGSLLQTLKLEGDVDINSNRVRLHGKLGYEFNNTFPFGVVDVIVALGVAFEGDFDYDSRTKTLNAGAAFEGFWDVDLDTPLGTANLISGRSYLAASLQASPNRLKVQGTAQVSWDVWIYADSAQLDVGFETAL